MSADDQDVTVAEVNRNVIELRKELSTMSNKYVPLSLWEENRNNVGVRIGEIEKDVAEMRKLKQSSTAALTSYFLFPLLLLVVGAALGTIVRLLP